MRAFTLDGFDSVPRLRDGKQVGRRVLTGRAHLSRNPPNGSAPSSPHTVLN